MTDETTAPQGHIRVSGRITVSAEGSTIADAVAAYRAQHGGESPEEWENVLNEDEGGSIVAWCEECGRAILDSERFATGEDCDLCLTCYPPEFP